MKPAPIVPAITPPVMPGAMPGMAGMMGGAMPGMGGAPAGWREAMAFWNNAAMGIPDTGVRNVADRDPPLAPAALGFISSVHNALGRGYYLTVTKTFD